MIVLGSGLVATAFRRYGTPTAPGVVFARGVADSTTRDPIAFSREMRHLEAAVEYAARLGEPLVFFSSAPVYGRFGGEAVTEATAPSPTTDYGRHKLACELLVRGSPGPSLVMRLPNIVGPSGNAHQLIPALVAQVLGGSVTVREGARRDLIDVEDVVSIAERLLTGPGVASLEPLGRIVNVASGYSTPAEEIVRRIAAIVGVEPSIAFVPGGESQRFDVSRLSSLVALDRFDSDYHRRTLDRYVPILAEREMERQGRPGAG